MAVIYAAEALISGFTRFRAQTPCGEMPLGAKIATRQGDCTGDNKRAQLPPVDGWDSKYPEVSPELKLGTRQTRRQNAYQNQYFTFNHCKIRSSSCPTYLVKVYSMDSINVSELVERLGSDEDAVRKMAVFKLQSNIGDPSFADVFILEGGLTKLRYLALHATGNTLAYSLTSFSRLLEVDKGWEYVNQDLVERVMNLSDPAKQLLTMY